MRATYNIWKLVEEYMTNEDNLKAYKKSLRTDQGNGDSKTKDTAKAVPKE